MKKNSLFAGEMIKVLLSLSLLFLEKSYCRGCSMIQLARTGGLTDRGKRGRAVCGGVIEWKWR